MTADDSQPHPRWRKRLKDVAELAGVSPAVVSTVLSGRTDSSVRVSPATAARVTAAANKLGYVPNSMARSLVVGHKRIIGVFTYERLFSPETVDHYSPFLFGIEQECENLSYDLLLVSSVTASQEPPKVISDGLNRLDFADGGILFGVESDRRDLEQLSKMGYPYVFIGRRETQSGEALSVGADYAGGTQILVSKMLEAGHRRFAYVGLDSDREFARDREAGFRAALDSVPNATAVATWRGTTADLSTAVFEAWQRTHATAFIAETPAQASRLVELAAAAGLRLRDDYSLAVLADVHYAEKVAPNLATLKVPRVDMGRAAVQLLVSILPNGKAIRPPSPRVIACEVVLGESIGPVS